MNIEEIYFAALEYDDPVARAAYLDAACGIDTESRQRVERLLVARSERGSFLEPPAPGPTTASDSYRSHELLGTVIGPYKLLEVVGEGGMGVVYMAEQAHPVCRTVALKLIKPGMDTRQVIARFEAEHQALAMMDHPNISHVLEAGATESGRPYFVMELVKGIPITEYSDQHRLSIDDRLGLFLLVCEAVHHAHQKGIIHRDIKPSHVLITLQDGVAVPKIIDFGIAKAVGYSLTEKTLFTGVAQLIGTPLYMSPEQAELSGTDVDTRSDIYSLGVLLYELLAGTTPFDQEAFRRGSFDEVRRIIREQVPPRPSTRLSGLGATLTTVSANRQTDVRKLNHLLHGELDWITMKALEKDRRRRYETVHAFASDIGRYRANLPVSAGPPSAWYRFRKFARRHRLFLSTAAVILAVWALYAWRLHSAQRTAELSRDEFRRQEIQTWHHRYVADIRQADQLVQTCQGRRALELLRRYRPAPGVPDVRNFAWYYLMRLCHEERRTLRGHTGAVYHAGFSPDGRTLVSCGQDGTVRFWDVATGRPLGTLPAPDQASEVNSADFSADGRTLVTAGDDGKVRLWDITTRSVQATIAAHVGGTAARFTPDGRRLISAGRNDGLVKLWDLGTYRQLASTRASETVIEAGAFSPDGKTLATAGVDGFVRLWDLADLGLKRSFPVQRGTVFALAFSADGSRLATGNGDGTVIVWDLPGVKRRNDFQGARHTSDVQSVAFAAGDRMIVSGGDYGILSLWDAATGKALGSLLGHSEKIWDVSVAPDGKTIASASGDGTVKLWDARPPRHDRDCAYYAQGMRSMGFTLDGQTLLIADTVGGTYVPPAEGPYWYQANADLQVSGFDTITGSQRLHRRLQVAKKTNGSGLTRDGTIAFFMDAYEYHGSPEGSATMWDVATGKRLVELDHITSCHPAYRQFVLVQRNRRPFELLNPETGQGRTLSGTEYLNYLTCSPRGDFLAAQDREDLIVLWNMATNRVIRSGMDRPRGTVAAFAPDGSILATESDMVIQLWDVPTLKLLGTLTGHTRFVRNLDFSPDGKTLLSASEDGTVKLWDVEASAVLLTLPGPFSGTGDPRFAPDGRTLFYWAATEGGATLHMVPTALSEDLTSEEGP